MHRILIETHLSLKSNHPLEVMMEWYTENDDDEVIKRNLILFFVHPKKKQV